ncbi:MAG: DnaJ domain-containing protein [Chloroflexota bacterium]
MLDYAERSTTRDAYAILQVDREADQEIIVAAYRALARRYHPDGASPDLRRMAEINGAYEHVKSPEARARYDRELRRPSTSWGLDGDTWSTRARPAWAAPRAETVSAPPVWKRGEPTYAANWSMPPRNPDEEVIDFGRYAGWTIPQVASENPEYLRWLSRHSAGVRFRQSIIRVLGSDPELGHRPSVVI